MSPPIILCTLKTAPRKQRAWDVVRVSEASPMPIYYDGDDINIIRVSPQSITGQYTFDMRNKYQCLKVLQAARIQLLHEIKKDRYNVLLGEGWRLTQLRKGSLLRIIVVYSGRPAVALGDIICRTPPFAELLDNQ